MMRNSENLLRKWLEIDYNWIARRARFTHEHREITIDLVYETIRFLDSETTMNKQPNRNVIIAIIALMWEHADHEVYDLKDICIRFLSRIGYPASAIICDKGFDEKECNFSPTHSALDEISRSFLHACNEVSIRGKNYLLTDFQKEIWQSMDEEKVIGISAPTSAGKSFVLLLKLVDRLVEEKINVVYIVPTLSLVNQVTEDFNKLLKSIKCTDCRIVNAFEAGKGTGYNYIYVLTQERAVAALSNDELAFVDDLILVADEIQNIERINQEGAERSRILYDTLIEFRHMKNVRQIIIAGPRIENIGEIGKNLFGSKSKAHETSISPVLNITYSINKVRNKFFFKQYTTLLREPIVHEIKDSSSIIGYGKKSYTDAYLQYFQEFVKCTGGQQNIIFAPTAPTARVMATNMEICHDNLVIQEELINYYKETIHEKYALCDALRKGIAYHHGRLPVHVRRTLERAITEKKISNVVCTTTLLQGVNLPAQNVYIRNPHLYVKKMLNATELTSYEMANLRGRAGRLLKDFVGRTFVMDESEFVDSDGYEQETLFEDITKELPSNYETKFEEYRDEIEEALANNTKVNGKMDEYGHLISYIRQSILRYGDKSRARMKEVGISLSKEQVAAINAKLNCISVPKTVCMKNRYWDPLVLDVMYTKFTGELPNTPYDKKVKNKIDEMMQFLRDNHETVDMYERYIPKDYRSGRGRGILVSIALKWARGDSLKDILSGKKYNEEDGADRIEETIDLLQTIVSYKMPLLFKPFYDMKESESSFLVSMQSGASDAITRTMIEMGIPRETAIELFNNHLDLNPKSEMDKGVLEEKIRKIIAEKYDNLPYWLRVQLDFLV